MSYHYSYRVVFSKEDGEWVWPTPLGLGCR